MRVVKIKLKKGDLVDLHYENDKGDNITLEGANQAHPDLVAAVQNLSYHLAEICEIETQGDFSGPMVTATGFTLGGDGDHAGMVIIGNRKLANNRVLNLVTPFVKFDPDFEPYAECHKLFGLVLAAQAEAEKYITGEKVGGAVQTELFAPAE